MASPPIAILGTGAHAPGRILTNEELAQRVDTSHEWIVSRTGIRERRIAEPGQTTADRPSAAAARSGCSPSSACRCSSPAACPARR